MVKQYKEETLLRTCNCDFTGQWRPSAILETMQEVAGTHSELIGVGRNALIEQDLVWVLTRVEVVMNRYPKVTDTISVETFPMPVRRWFFPRYFVFRDDQGQELGRAGSLWVLLNLSTRHMAPPDSILSLMPDQQRPGRPVGTARPGNGSLRRSNHGAQSSRLYGPGREPSCEQHQIHGLVLQRPGD